MSDARQKTGGRLVNPRRSGAAILAAVAFVSVPVLADDMTMRDSRSMMPAGLASPVFAAVHAEAQITCRGAMLESRIIACPLLETALSDRVAPWVWETGTGETINRKMDFDYRVRQGSCLDAFCTWYECEVSAWPKLDCTDGSERMAAAPDDETFELGDVTYTKVRPQEGLRPQ